MKLAKFVLTAVLLATSTVGFNYAFGAIPLINNPLFPSTALPGGAGFTLYVVGTGFTSNSVVNWNGEARATTFISSTKLSASILSSDIAVVGTASVIVLNPGPGGGSSNVDFFTINTPVSVVTFTDTNYDAGSANTVLTIGDFNGDGTLDVAALDNGRNLVWIELGNGNGTFQSGVSYATGTEPVSIATGDFNGDGRLDLVIANEHSCSGPSSVSILLGNGDGTFAKHKDFKTGSCPDSIAVGDFNGDGNLDLAVANDSGSQGTVSILLGNGDGSFQTPINFPAGANPIGITTGDFNRDGKLDLAISDTGGSGSVMILLGNGDGTFSRGHSFPSAKAGYGITAVDLNHDAKLDLVMSIDQNPDGGAMVLLGNGDGTFGTANLYVSGKNPIYLAVADVNNDGTQDLILTNANSNTLSILLNRGDGTFPSHIDYTTGPAPGGVMAGDFNGDGRLDVAVMVANQSPTLSIFLQ